MHAGVRLDMVCILRETSRAWGNGQPDQSPKKCSLRDRVNALCLLSSSEIMTAVTALPEVGSAESLCGREARGLFDTQRDRAPLV